jgi:serine/threonine protein kinase/formylglycine-generating enzyme required for sulfatase activity
MRECPVCFTCYDDSVAQCPNEGRATFHSLHGDVVLDRRYVLERRLGEGGMGIVYKAEHRLLKATRAIKIIRHELVGNDPSFAKRFHQEAMTAAAIKHPNIIGVPDFGFLDESIPFIVMEFVEGISLQELMNREGKFTPEKALEYMRVIASAVAAAHAHGIVHRDLKPLNIMIQSGRSAREQVRILDFGLAKIKSDLFGSFVGAKTTGIIGSPYYMAPEQWSDEEADKRCDIYSLGIMLHQMLAGDVPFKGSGIPAIMKKHLMSQPPPLALPDSGISVELERVVHHALEKEPENRPASAEIFVEELEKAVAALSGAKPKTKTRTRKTKPGTGTRRKTSDTARAETDSQGAGVLAETVRDESDSLSEGAGAISQPENSAGRISVPEMETIVAPVARSEVEEGRVSRETTPEPSPPTVSQSDLLRKASEEARRIAEAKALREFEESGELPPSVGSSSLPQPKAPVLPGRVLEGQESIVNVLLRKRYVMPLAAGVVIVGLLVLLPLVYFRADTEQPPPITTTQPAKPAREMVLIQGGSFVMGWNSGGVVQRGEHQVSVESFLIDKHEVTNAEYAEFIKATGRPAPTNTVTTSAAQYWKAWNGNLPPSGRERWPVTNVSPKDANDFARWLSNRDGVEYRLPSEAEWEFAARNGSQGTLFPWGNSWVNGRANINQTQGPRDVGSFPDGATKDGVLDMVGNVWEWTASKASLYNGSPVVQDVNGRVMRGGSYDEQVNGDLYQNSTSRNWFGDEDSRYPTIGFRLVRKP